MDDLKLPKKLEIGMYVVDLNGDVRKITQDDMPDLPYEKIARLAHNDEIEFYEERQDFLSDLLDDKAIEITIEIFKVILKEQNGFTDEEIETNNLADNCYGTEMFEGIREIVRNNI